MGRLEWELATRNWRPEDVLRLFRCVMTFNLGLSDGAEEEDGDR